MKQHGRSNGECHLHIARQSRSGNNNLYGLCRVHRLSLGQSSRNTTRTGQLMKLSQQLFHEATALFWTGGDEDTIHNLVRRALTERGYEELYADNADSEDED